MLRVPIWATAFALVAGGSLAAPPSLEAPVQAPRTERAAPSVDWNSPELRWPLKEELAAETIVIAK
jgi:hypothetical protein